MATQVRKLLGKSNVVRLTKLGFTVGATTITGGTDGKLARWLVGGKASLYRLKRLGIRA